MNRKKIIIGVLVVLLVVSIGNYSRNTSTVNVRSVDFLTIWAIGAISGLLIYRLIELLKKGK